MKVVFIMTLFLSGILVAQTKLIKDIDFDGIKDTVYIDAENSKLVSLLSTIGNFICISVTYLKINKSYEQFAQYPEINPLKFTD